ncbi:MAG TPA: SRPBCC domain-containing protein [Candidatus Dormibacteraeota bacterium]|nr:SRPBCC domain-containing protein [Candidatus Dormibacteraeota bacterium]
MIAPIKVSFTVACLPEHAFDTWTERASSWWPPEHTVSHERGAHIVFEPRAGGRIFERTATGEEIEWGRIVEWDRPRRLRYLWHIATDPHNATDVEIVFRALPDTSTRVEIEHGGWERLGHFGRRWREANIAGWDGVLPPYQNEIRVSLHSRPGG